MMAEPTIAPSAMPAIFAACSGGGDAKTDGAGRLGVLPHHLYNGGKVGFDLTAGAGDAKAGHDKISPLTGSTL